MRTKTTFTSFVFITLAAFAVTGVSRAAGTFVIGGPAASLAPSSSTYSIDGSVLTAFRSAVTNPANFGPSGTVQKTVSFQFMSTITPSALNQVNAFMAPWWFATDSAPYNQMVMNYFLAGGNLILLNDSTNQNGVSGLLGIPTVGQSDGTVENGAAPLFSGPFGSASNVPQAFQIGYFTAANITSHGGTVCATNGGGQATAACFSAGAYAPGAGELLIINDVDSWTTQATFGPQNANGTFALNGVAFIVNSPSSLTSPSSVPALSNWVLITTAILLMAAAAILIGRRKETGASA